MIQNDTTTTNKQINEYYMNITEVLSIDIDKMETSEPKWVNSYYILYGINSLRVKDLQIISLTIDHKKNFIIITLPSILNWNVILSQQSNNVKI